MAFFDKTKLVGSMSEAMERVSDTVSKGAAEAGRKLAGLDSVCGNVRARTQEAYDNLHKYTCYFDTDALWRKIKDSAASIGQRMVYMALTIYYTLSGSLKGMGAGVDDIARKINPADVVVLTGALGYLILPTDIVPDIIAGIGFTDDMAVMTMAFKRARNIFSSVAQGTALEKTAEIFGEKFDKTDLESLVDNSVRDITDKINKTHA